MKKTWSLLGLICLVWLLAGCSVKESATTDLPPVTETPVRTSSPTSIPSVTPTPTRTPRPTYTKRPSETPVPLLPVQIAIRASPEVGKKYQLTDWTPEKADQLLNLLYDYRKLIHVYYRSEYLYDGFAVFAEKEAELLFPESSFKKQWQRDILYTAVSANMGVDQRFADLVLDALVNEKVKLDDLENWFGAETKVEILPLQPIPGYQSSQIVVLKVGQYLNMVSCFWLLEKGGMYEAYPLSPNREYGTRLTWDYSLKLTDFTNDGYPEIVLTQTEYQSFNIHTGNLVIYDLGQVPPRQIELDVVPVSADIAKTSLWLDGQTPIGLSFKIPIAIESGLNCEDVVTWNYGWNGEELVLAGLFPPQIENMQENKLPCLSYMFETAFLWKMSTTGNPVIIHSLSRWINEYPDYAVLGFMARGNDQSSFRFKYGLLLAYWGEDELAKKQMKTILNGPEVINPTVTEYASEFLQNFQGKETLLDTCLKGQFCSPYLSLKELISLIPVDRFSETNDILKRLGITVTDSGKQDFDGDGVEDNWAALSDEENNTILITYLRDGEIRSFDTNFYFSDDETILENLKIEKDTDPLEPDALIFKITSETNPKIEEILRFPEQDKTQFEELDEIAHAIGVEYIASESAIAQLNAIKLGADGIGFGDNFIEYPPLKKAYLTALAFELAGEREKAADAYLKIWREYPGSAFALMAQAKLEPVP